MMGICYFLLLFTKALRENFWTSVLKLACKDSSGDAMITTAGNLNGPKWGTDAEF